MGFFRILAGSNVLGIESNIAWATPGRFTTTNFPCHEDGANCAEDEEMATTMHFVDPSKTTMEAVQRRLSS